LIDAAHFRLAFLFCRSDHHLGKYYWFCGHETGAKKSR
jgi:hypothetical protein